MKKKYKNNAKNLKINILTLNSIILSTFKLLFLFAKSQKCVING